ncbi:MAG: YdcF family protein, partial [Candidatus Woesearchaeota archaeon]
MKNAIIVLAGGIEKDGSLPPMTKYRVEKGVELYKQGVASKIILSGSWSFLYDFTPARTEAEAMQEYAVSLGVKKDDIILEADSKDTLGEAYFLKVKFLEPRRWFDIAVVTSEFHLQRTRYLFNKVLGKNFDIEFVGCDSRLSKEELEKKMLEEA